MRAEVAHRIGADPARTPRPDWSPFAPARQYLEETTEPVAEIAERCGYATSDGLCLAFERNLSVTPRAYRKRFASADRSGP